MGRRMVIVISFLMVGFLACSSSSLSRSKAKKIIMNSSARPRPLTYSIEVGEVTHTCSASLSDEKDMEKCRKDMEEFRDLYKKLEQHGYIKIESWREERKPSVVLVYFRIKAKVSLTPKAIKRWSKDKRMEALSDLAYASYRSLTGVKAKRKSFYFEIPLCDKVIDKITGITHPSTGMDGMIHAMVEYTWKLDNCQEEFFLIYGEKAKEVLEKTRGKGEGLLTLYDDGWRVAHW